MFGVWEPIIKGYYHSDKKTKKKKKMFGQAVNKIRVVNN